MSSALVVTTEGIVVAKFNPAHVSAGSSAGGQFAPKGASPGMGPHSALPSGEGPPGTIKAASVDVAGFIRSEGIPRAGSSGTAAWNREQKPGWTVQTSGAKMYRTETLHRIDAGMTIHHQGDRPEAVAEGNRIQGFLREHYPHLLVESSNQGGGVGIQVRYHPPQTG